jgi:hypothetical protein
MSARDDKGNVLGVDVTEHSECLEMIVKVSRTVTESKQFLSVYEYRIRAYCTRVYKCVN